MEEDGSCILQGKDTKYGKVTGLDLELTRMLHANEDLKIPSARSQLIKYAAINKLLLQSQDRELGEDSTLVSRSQRIMDKRISYKDLLTAIGADRNRCMIWLLKHTMKPESMEESMVLLHQRCFSKG